MPAIRRDRDSLIDLALRQMGPPSLLADLSDEELNDVEQLAPRAHELLQAEIRRLRDLAEYNHRPAATDLRTLLLHMCEQLEQLLAWARERATDSLPDDPLPMMVNGLVPEIARLKDEIRWCEERMGEQGASA